MGGPEGAENDIANGRPIFLKVRFPFQSHLPRPIAIYFNNKRLCSDWQGEKIVILREQQAMWASFNFQTPVITRSSRSTTALASDFRAGFSLKDLSMSASDRKQIKRATTPQCELTIKLKPIVHLKLGHRKLIWFGPKRSCLRRCHLRLSDVVSQKVFLLVQGWYSTVKQPIAGNSHGRIYMKILNID